MQQRRMPPPQRGSGWRVALVQRRCWCNTCCAPCMPAATQVMPVVKTPDTPAAAVTVLTSTNGRRMYRRLVVQLPGPADARSKHNKAVTPLPALLQVKRRSCMSRVCWTLSRAAPRRRRLSWRAGRRCRWRLSCPGRRPCCRCWTLCKEKRCCQS